MNLLTAILIFLAIFSVSLFIFTLRNMSKYREQNDRILDNTLEVSDTFK